MSGGGQRGTGNDYVLFIFFLFDFIMRGDTTETFGASGRTSEDFKWFHVLYELGVLESALKTQQHLAKSPPKGIIIIIIITTQVASYRY